MAVVIKKGIYIVAAKRTPFGKLGGKLRDVGPADLLAIAVKAALKAGDVSPCIIDTVNIGQVFTISGRTNGALTAQHAALKSGIPKDKSVLTINKLCGSGFQAVINGAQEILTGTARASLSCGIESLSNVPFLVRDIRFGVGLHKSINFEDFLIVGSKDSYCGFTMAETAENCAEKYDINREEADDYAFQSQQKTKLAYENGVFDAEMAPVTLKEITNDVVVDKDEQHRPHTTMEELSKLPALFKKGGIGTAGNSTGISDGAGAIILAGEAAIEQHGLTPLVRLVGWSCAGVEPSMMGMGPVPAVNCLLRAVGMTLDDMDMIEIGEPFAIQTLASVKELKVDHAKLNINGGAIAIGHPPGAAGARVTAHLAHELGRRRFKRGLAATCIGGGQGIAMIFETV